VVHVLAVVQNKMKLSLIPLFSLSILFARAGEQFISPEYGFVAQFPAAPLKHDVDNPIGKITLFQAADGNEETSEVFLYQIFVQKIKGLKDFEANNPENLTQLIQTRLDAKMAELKPIKYESKISKLATWPAIEFMSSHNGIMIDGLVTYKRGIMFINNGAYYTVQVHGLSDNKRLIDITNKFWSTLLFPDQKSLAAMIEMQKGNKANLAQPENPN